MIIKWLFLIFVLFALSRVIYRLVKKDTTWPRAVFWLILWVAIGAAVSYPQQTDYLASQLGVSRGADLLVYTSVLTLFYLVYKILGRLEKIDHHLTALSRELALRSPLKNQNKNSLDDDQV